MCFLYSKLVTLRFAVFLKYQKLAEPVEPAYLDISPNVPSPHPLPLPATSQTPPRFPLNLATSSV